jgi:hypothetical protein
MSDRLVRWVEYFSLFDFDQQYIPGERNVLQDHISRPTSSVVLSSDQTCFPGSMVGQRNIGLCQQKNIIKQV